MPNALHSSFQQDFAFDFIGLVGRADPLRQSVPAAVRECQTAGIRVVMITGDYPATAREIACQAGLAGSDVVTGDELVTLSDEQLAARVRTTTVFARIMPEQKLRIVEALKPPRSRYLRQPAQGDVLYFSGAGAHRWTSASAACVRSTDSVRTDPHRIPPNGNRPRLLARVRG